MTDGPMIFDRKARYLASADALLTHLDGLLCADDGYPDPPSWGYAFTYLAALASGSDQHLDLAKKAVRHLARQNEKNRDFAWEFVVYALQQTKRLNADAEIPFDGYRSKGTRMFNWYLLRIQNKSLCDCLSFIDLFTFRSLLKIYQTGTGLVLDEFKTRSLQYHAFSLFVMCNIFEQMPEQTWLKEHIVRGVRCSLDHILSDGTALFLGRGQEQIFGYGALLYVLDYCHTTIGQIDETAIDLVARKLLSFQRHDGSYPLVLRQREPELEMISFAGDTPAGWYGYNTLYDYQPFLAYCLLKTGQMP